MSVWKIGIGEKSNNQPPTARLPGIFSRDNDDTLVIDRTGARDIRANTTDYSPLPIITLWLKALDRLAPLDPPELTHFRSALYSVPANLPSNRIDGKLLLRHGEDRRDRERAANSSTKSLKSIGSKNRGERITDDGVLSLLSRNC